MDQNIILIVAGLAAVLGVVLLVRLFRNPVDRFDAPEEADDFVPDPDDLAELDIQSRELKAQNGKSKRVKTEKRRKKAVLNGSRCEHHFEITGFPPDRIGTHVNITCKKCGIRDTVTVADSRELLRQRDDVRSAVRRARGD